MLRHDPRRNPDREGAGQDPEDGEACMMRKTALKPSTKPMKRSSMNRGTSTLKRSSMQPGRKALHKAALKQGTKRLRARPPAMTPIRKSARNEDCTLRFHMICRNRTETTVWCHSNSAEDGKGTGLKARDEEGCYGCYECHCFLDGGWVQYPGWTREMVDAEFDRARHESRVKLERKGLLKVEQ
jgi:hypothetical protein